MNVISDQNLYLFLSTPIDEGDENRAFILQHLHGQEKISSLFHYHLQLDSTMKSIHAKDILEKSVTVTIKLSNGNYRYINGIVSSFVQSGSSEGVTSYHAEIRPFFWMLTLTQHCKIFQKQSVPEIIDCVLRDYNIDVINNINRDYEVRDYCVQYQESDYHFLARLMEDEGIFYCFKHAKDKHELILMDSTDTYEHCIGYEKIQLSSNAHDVHSEGLISECHFIYQVIPDDYTIKSADYRNPDLPLEETTQSKTSGNRSYYSFETERSLDSNFLKQASLDRMEAFEVNEKILTGKGFTKGFVSGFKFSLTNHHQSEFNQDYIINQLSISATQSEYENSFTAFPANIPFRPPKITEKPRIYGTQTATVVGEKGSEIYRDEMGRIKVQFHWDREGKGDENSSCWIRVAQPWAGIGYGTSYTPRVSHEVLIVFDQGDPDLPVVIGCLYNGKNHHPYSDEKTISGIKSDSSKGSGGYCEISIDDQKDNEHVYIRSEKNTTIETQNNKNERIGNNETHYVEKDRKKTVKGEESESIGKDKSTSITDNYFESVGKNKEMETGKDFSVSTGGNFIIDVAKEMIVNIKKKLDTKINNKVVIKVSDSISLTGDKELVIKIGSASVTIKKDGTIDIKCKDFNIKSSGNISMKANKIAAN
jgi:type VI secretion system secreted protein VgrG